MLCVPMDIRIPKIRIHVANVQRFAGQRLVVRMDGWPVSSRYVSGQGGVRLFGLLQRRSLTF